MTTNEIVSIYTFSVLRSGKRGGTIIVGCGTSSPAHKASTYKYNYSKNYYPILTESLPITKSERNEILKAVKEAMCDLGFTKIRNGIFSTENLNKKDIEELITLIFAEILKNF